MEFSNICVKVSAEFPFIKRVEGPKYSKYIPEVGLLGNLLNTPGELLPFVSQQ